MGKSPLKDFLPPAAAAMLYFENAVAAATDPSVFRSVLRSISEGRFAMINLAWVAYQ